MKQFTAYTTKCEKIEVNEFMKMIFLVKIHCKLEILYDSTQMLSLYQYIQHKNSVVNLMTVELSHAFMLVYQ